MRKLLAAVLAIVFLAGYVFADDVIPAVAKSIIYDEIIKDKLIVSGEMSFEDKNIENLNLISIGALGLVDASLKLKTSDVSVDEYLVNIGYKISENLIPYTLIGAANVSFNNDLSGAITTPWFSGSTNLTEVEFRETAFAIGGGAMGKLTQIASVDIGYDVRYLMFDAEDTDEGIEIIPGFTGLNGKDVQKISYNELKLSLIASKEFVIKNVKFIKSVVPYLGYRYSKININKTDDISISPVSVSTESNLEGDLNSCLVGATVNLNDRLSLAVGGVFGDENGVQSKVTWKF